MFERFLRLIRSQHASGGRPASARERHYRASLECLESRNLLSFASFDYGYQLDIEQLPKPDTSQLDIWPIKPIAGGGFPVPPYGPSLPWPPHEPNLPPAPSAPPGSDLGGYTEIDNTDKSQPDILVGPASDKVAREVLEMLASLQFVPSTHDLDTRSQPERVDISSQSALTNATFDAHQDDDSSEGGMIALAHDAAIVHTLAKDSVSHDDLDSWLNTPVRMDTAHGKFQAFEVSASDEIPSGPAPQPNNDATYFTPLKSPVETAPAATADPTPQTSIPTDSPSVTRSSPEAITDLVSSPAAPLDAIDKNATSQSAAAAAIFVFLAARAVRAVRSTDSTDSADQVNLSIRKPRQKPAG